MLIKLLKASVSLLFPESHSEELAFSLSESELIKKIAICDTGNAVALFRYKDPVVRALIWRAKYKNDERAVALLGAALAHHLKQSHDMHTLVPIPLSKSRLRARGYNQAERIAASAAALSGANVETSALERKDAPVQTGLRRDERLKNLSGAFYVPDTDRVSGKTCVLVDDVTTTGATFKEAGDALVRAGARSVRCIAIAH